MSSSVCEIEDKDSQYLFEIIFPTCNSFRQILQFLNQFHKQFHFVFTKKEYRYVKKMIKRHVFLKEIFTLSI